MTDIRLPLGGTPQIEQFLLNTFPNSSFYLTGETANQINV